MFDIKLDRDAEESLYIQIHEAIRAEILSDQYTPDTKMTSIRKLASRLDVNSETVVKAYRLLAAENLIYQKEGSGSYIAPAAALKNNDDDQRLRILSSKTFIAPDKNIDFSGTEMAAEFLEEYSWDLIFDQIYSELKGNIFKQLKQKEYFNLLEEQYPNFEKQKYLYNSNSELEKILQMTIEKNAEILFTKGNNISVFNDFLRSKYFKQKNEKFSIQDQKNIHISSPNYDDLMNYLEENTIDYLLVSDESIETGILNWSLSKLKSLLELSQMLDFKIVIFEYFSLYQKTVTQELINSKFKDQIILIQAMTERVFPGLETGLIYLDSNDFKSNKSDGGDLSEYKLTELRQRGDFSAGDNLIYNLLNYYLENNYLTKRTNLIKKRLKNKKILLVQNIKDHFRGIKVVENESLFYQKLILSQEINLHDFKIFAEKNSILLPEHNKFSFENKSKQLIISPATLKQFSIKQGVMALAKVYWQFIS